jgi:hypothetical protein
MKITHVYKNEAYDNFELWDVEENYTYVRVWKGGVRPVYPTSLWIKHRGSAPTTFGELGAVVDNLDDLDQEISFWRMR